MTTTTPFSGPDTATGTGNPSSVVIIEGTYARYRVQGHYRTLAPSFTKPLRRLIATYALPPQPTFDVPSPRRWAVEQAEDGVDVEMGRQQIGDQIELGVASRGDVGVADDESATAGRVGDTGEPGTAEVVVVEQAVPMSAEDGTARDALRLGVDPEPAFLGAPGEPPMVDFISGERLPPAAQDLRLAKGDVGVQQAQPGHHPHAGFDRVLDAPAQHLQPPADAQHRLAGQGVIDHRAGQTAIVQPGQIRDGGLAARKHDQI